MKPGRFDHFEISAPLKIVAGQDAEIRLQAMDAFKNTLSAFGETGRSFQIGTTGSATVTPAAFKSASFKNGVFTFFLKDKTAQKVTLTITEEGSSIPVVLKELTILPEGLKSFEVMGPKTVAAGERFFIHIMARDAFGNTVTELISSRDMKFDFKTSAGQKVETVSVPDFAQGFTVATLSSDKVGTLTVEVRDQKTGSTGVSGEIAVTNGPAHSFRIASPAEIMQGESFGVAIEALDRFGNLVLDYSATGKGLQLTSSGKTKTVQQTVAAHAFSEGKAAVVATYEGTDKEITLYAAESGKVEKSKGRSISVIAPVPTRIEVTTPSTAMAGEKFKIQVTVYNQKGNVFRNFSSLGRDVTLKTTGKGDLVPNKIRSSEFINGTAVAEVLYNRSENFDITADTPGMKAPEPPAPAPAPAPVRAAETPKPEKPAAKAKTKGKKEIAKKEELPAAESPKPAAPEAPKVPAVAPEVAKPAPAPAAPEVKQAKAAEPEKKAQPAEVAALKPGTKAAKAAEKAKEEAAKKEQKLASKKPMKGAEVSSLSLIETEEKTLILLHVPNLPETSDAKTSVEASGDKIVLKVKPALNKLEKIPQFDSAYVKHISVEEDKQDKGTLIIKIELIKPVQYQLKEGKTSVVLTLSH
ncbi:MAG: hypothetical protein HGA78_09225 [Nitrospirales bacterium]|nr:hypothetical protein [Nitrospirales bacterium]